MPNNTTSLLDALRRLFPACVTEAQGQDGQLRPAIDFDALRQELSDQLVDGPDERYQLTWPGKRAAMQLANEPCAKTLRPKQASRLTATDSQASRLTATDSQASRLTATDASDAALSAEQLGVKHHAGAENIGAIDSLATDLRRNLFIEGDNLDALKLLQETYLARVKAIYIDPPYNTGKDFIYSDKFALSKKEWKQLTGERAEDGRLMANPDSSGRYHSNWLSMMYPRLKLARNLLARNGVIFISIDDHEQHNLRKLMDEIFGAANFIAQFSWHSKFSPANDAKTVSRQHEHIICYAREIDEFQIGMLPRTQEMDARFKNPDNDPRGDWQSISLHAKSGRESDLYTLTLPNGVKFECPTGRFPLFNQEKLLELYHDNRLWFGKTGKSVPREKVFLSEVKQGKTPSSVLHFREVGSTHEANEDLAKLVGKGMFSNPKPVRLVEHLLRLSTSPKKNGSSVTLAPGQLGSSVTLAGGDIVMDFFAGSGTTAHAVMKLNQEDGGNRRFILVQWPEKCGEKTEAFKAGFKTIADLCQERIRRAAQQLAPSTHLTII